MTEVKIGLETHIQLDTNTKLFCGCPNEEAEEPNTHVCPTCLGHPGSKPRLNKAVVKKAVKTAMSLQCDINEDIFFSRKTYFYPDMSKNYQITQYEVPVGETGEIEIEVGDEKKEIGITRLHIEEDPAKMKHVGGSISDADYSKIDYNRAGTPLLEIVTDPDFKSPEEARAYLQQLAQIFQYLEIYSPESDFAIKSDANISIDGGEKVEVKNITGTSEVEKALSYEISRQKQVKRRGQEVNQQTRSYNAGMSVTEALREKETEKDYGYIFDPDLTRQQLGEEFRETIRKDIPELPHEKFQRFKEEYGLSDKLVESLVTEPAMADDFERLANEFNPKLAASWMTGELKKTLNYQGISYEEVNQNVDNKEYLFVFMRVALKMLQSDRTNQREAEQYIRDIVKFALDSDKKVEFEKKDPEDVQVNIDFGIELEEKSDESEVDQIVSEVIEDNPDAVDDYESGEDGAINFLVGQVMQNSGGKADPKSAREKIVEKLE